MLHQEGSKKSQSTCSLSSRGWNYLHGACSDLDIPINAHNGYFATITNKSNEEDNVWLETYILYCSEGIHQKYEILLKLDMWDLKFDIWHPLITSPILKKTKTLTKRFKKKCFLKKKAMSNIFYMTLWFVI